MWIAWKSCNVSSAIKVTKGNRICSATSAGPTVRLEQKMTLNVTSVTRSIQEKGISTDMLNPHIKTYFWFFFLVYFSPFISQGFLVWKYMFIIVSILFSICYSWSLRVAFGKCWTLNLVCTHICNYLWRRDFATSQLKAGAYSCIAGLGFVFGSLY